MATVRIYKVAELLNTSSQEVMALLKRDHGIDVKSASSTIEEVVARQFVERLARQRNITVPSSASFADTPAAVRGKKPAGKAPEPQRPATPALPPPRLVKTAKPAAPPPDPRSRNDDPSTPARLPTSRMSRPCRRSRNPSRFPSPSPPSRRRSPRPLSKLKNRWSLPACLNQSSKNLLKPPQLLRARRPRRHGR